MSDVPLNTTLAILAGGEGARMGRPKGLLTLAGRPILRHILQTARWPGPTLLVTSPGRDSPPASEDFDVESADPVAGLGPMRGVLTALEQAATEQVVVSAVDMPSLGAEIFRWLAEALHRRPAALAVMVERIWDHAHVIEPLPAAFRRSARNLLQQRLASGKASLHQLIECDHVRVVRAPENWSPALWANLNFPDDLTRWEPMADAQ